MLLGCLLRGGPGIGCYSLIKQEQVGLWSYSINTPNWAGKEGEILEHPWNESNWIQADYEICSAREIESSFPDTAGGSTFQYEALGGEALMALKELNTGKQAGCGLCDFLSSGSREVWARFPYLPHRGTAGG